MAARKKDGPGFTALQKQLNSELMEEKFRRVYLLCGDQDYLRSQNRDRLKKALLGDGDKMNLCVFSGADTDITAVIEQAETMPFLADRMVIVLDGTGILSGSAKGGDSRGDRLAAYLDRAPETTHFVISEGEVDKRKKLYKAIEREGFILPCGDLDDETIRRWAFSLFQKDKLNIRPETLSDFLELTGNDMFNIQTEASKLCAYCYGRSEVTASDIRAVCSVHLQDRIFEMIDAIVAKRPERALEIYMELLERQTAPQPILALMQRQFNTLLQVRELMDKRMGEGEIASKTGMSPYFIRKRYIPTASRYGRQVLISALEDCIQADQDYKSGLITDRIAVEMVIVRQSRRKS